MGNVCPGGSYAAESERPLTRGHPRSERGLSSAEMTASQRSKGRVDSVMPEMVAMGSRPRVHRNRTGLQGPSAGVHGVEQRSIPLKDCSDEQLLAEIDHRNIRLHEKVTGELVNQRYKFGRMLGQGSSATVYEARHKRSQREYAIKVIKKNDDMNDDESMATELDILKNVHHRYVLCCHELFETPQCIWVVMELIRGGELLDVLIEGGVYTERDAARVMKQAFLAVSYLHSLGIVHRDLKLQNMLLTEKDRTSDLKICDFGLSAQIQKDKLEWSDKDEVKKYHGLSDKWGTPQYFAPEMLWKAYGPQVDLWALGVVLFQLLVGRLPFNASTNQELFRQIERSPDHLKKLFAMGEWNGVSEPAKSLVSNLLEPDPLKRPNADEALEHEWIILRGVTGTGDLGGAQAAFKRQLAQKRLTSLWHVLEIMNALDDSPSSPGKQLPSTLLRRVSNAVTPTSRKRGMSQTDRLEELQTLFNMFDADGNGTIDQHEIAALFKKLGFEVRIEKLRELLYKVDTNANGSLEFGEFCEFLRLAKSAEKSGSGGLGIGEAVEGSFAAMASVETGEVSNEQLSDYLVRFAESTGQHISSDEIQDVLLLAAGDSGASNPQALREAMMLPSGDRHSKANARRKTMMSSKQEEASPDESYAASAV